MDFPVDAIRGCHDGAYTVDTGQYFKKGSSKAWFLKAYSKFQNPKVGTFLRAPEDFRGPQKTEKIYFSKLTNQSVDHKFTSFAIN